MDSYMNHCLDASVIGQRAPTAYEISDDGAWLAEKPV